MTLERKYLVLGKELFDRNKAYEDLLFLMKGKGINNFIYNRININFQNITCN